MDHFTHLAKIEQALASAKLGLPAQMKMAPRPRPGQKIHTEVEDVCLKAGVMLLLYPKDGALHLVFIRRTNTVLHHKDQISFPGGQMEPGEDFVQAAFRETWEELGVEPECVRTLGTLTPLYIQPSNFCIYPLVAAADAPLLFLPHPGEVAEIIEVPLDHLLDPRNVRIERWMVRKEMSDVPFYAYGNHKIWGATAMVLVEFLDLIQRHR